MKMKIIFLSYIICSTITNLHSNSEKRPQSKIITKGYMALSISSFSSAVICGAIAYEFFDDITQKRFALIKIPLLVVPALISATMFYISYKAYKKATQQLSEKGHP